MTRMQQVTQIDVEILAFLGRLESASPRSPSSWPVSRRSHPDSASDRAGWTAGQRFRLRGIVSTSFNVTFESLLPAVLFPALDDARATIVLSSAIVFVYALFIITVRTRQLIQAHVPWVCWTRFVAVSGFTATALFGLNALVFASLTVYALALCIQLSVAAISFYSLAAGATT